MNEEIIEISELQTVDEIEMDEAIGWSGGDNTIHNNLAGRDEPDQHPIKSIIGLRDKIDEMRTLQPVYSDKTGIANYYKWHENVSDEWRQSGYFVCMVDGSDTVQLCGGTDIFGVTVDEAAFIGGQLEVVAEEDEYGLPKHIYTTDNTYALVMTSGLVSVRCQSGVIAGEYVVSDTSGIAKKTNSGCGYKVISIDEKDGVNYAVISLGIQACTTDVLGQQLQNLTTRVDDAVINIAAIRLVADEANSKSMNVQNQTTQDLKDIEDKVNNANLNAGNANSAAEKAQKTADDAIKYAEQLQESAAKNHIETLDKMGELEKTIDVINGWEYPDPNHEGQTISGAEYFDQYVKDGLSTKASMETVEKLNEENKMMIEKNAENYQQIISSVDKYVVGEYSQSYGLSLEQANNILNKGMVYIPTEHVDSDTHTEAYTVTHNGKEYTYEIPFTKGKYYIWDDDTLRIETEDDIVDIPVCIWREGVGDVWPFEIVPAGQDYDFWYFGETLYKLMTPTWKNIDKLVARGTAAKFTLPYWFDGEKVYKITVNPDGETDKTECATIVSLEKPTNGMYEFWCCGEIVYQYTDALWSEFDKNVWHGELDATTSEYNYCFYNNTLCVLSLNDNGEKYWQARSTYFGDNAPSYTTYDFWYDGEKLRSLWCEVNTLSGNVNGRISSMIRHDVNSITAEVVNARGSVAGFGAWITDTTSATQQLSTWKNEEEEKMATIRTEAREDGAAVIISALQKNGDTVEEAASLTLNVVKDENGNPTSSLAIDADNINFTAEDYSVIASKISLTAKDYRVIADNINFTAEEYDVIASNIDLNGYVKVTDLSGKNSTIIDGSNIITKTIEADAINTKELSSISANLGVVESGELHSPGYNSIVIWGQNQSSVDSVSSVGLSYIKTDDGECYIVNGIGTCTDTDIVIPSMKDGLPVKYIDDQAFRYNADLTSITIPNSIIGIGYQAFLGCSGLTSIIIPDSVVNIGIQAFSHCSGLTYIKISNSVIDINRSTFALCTSLENLIIPDSVTFIDEYAFDSCSGLTNIIIGNEVRHISYSVFSGCENFKNIYYKGTPMDWDKISIDNSNEVLLNATRYYYSEEEPTDITYNYWHYNTGFKISCNDDYMIDSPHCQITQDGKIYAESGVFNGVINADRGVFNGIINAKEGEIGGLKLTTQGLSSGAGKLSFESSGLIIAQQLQIDDYLTVETFKVGKISGRGEQTPYLDFESSGTQTQTVKLTCSSVVETEGEPGWFGNYTAGKVKITLKAEPPLVRAHTFKVTLSYKEKNGQYGFVSTINLTILAGQQTSSISVSHLIVKDNQYGEDYYCYFQYADVDSNTYTEEIPESVDIISTSGSFRPNETGTLLLGSSDKKWKEIWCTQSSINSSSDKNLKNSIEAIPDTYEMLFDELKPVRYKFNDGESNRYHVGFISQDVRDALQKSNISTLDFAGYVEYDNNDGSKGYGLRYGEFIALCVNEIQKLKKRVDELEEKLNQK